jgi:hypothetical protein
MVGGPGSVHGSLRLAEMMHELEHDRPSSPGLQEEPIRCQVWVNEMVVSLCRKVDGIRQRDGKSVLDNSTLRMTTRRRDVVAQA